jgi:hypothetical protein
VILDIEAYARLMAELAKAGAAREQVLARCGLDEARWEAIDTHWQAHMSAALDAAGDDVPEIISAFAAAYKAVQRSLGPPISIEQFAQATRLLQATGDLRAALARTGVTMADYVRGSEHWSRRIAEEPEIERRFDEVVRGG